MKVKKIIAVTGARSEYGLLTPIYEKLSQNSKFDFSIIVTGPNLSENYGYAATNVENDGYRIAGKIFNLIDSSQKIGRIMSIGTQIGPLATILETERPDLVLVAGDREEAITTTMTCAYMDIAVAHFFGGDIAKDGNIDNSVRYASSKFAHLHFVTVESHRQTLLKLGEDDWRISVVGNPSIERLINTLHLTKEQTLQTISSNLSDVSNYAVLIQHPIITEYEDQEKNITATLEALLSNYEGIVFLNSPNSDAGNFTISSVYERYINLYPKKFYYFKNLPDLEYVNLLRHAEFLIGNSSSGLLEVASLGLPAINVGSRQRGRLAGENVIFVDYDQNEIESAINMALHDNNFKSEVEKKLNPYGDGRTSDKVLKILEDLEVSDKLLHKNITY